MTHHLTIEGCPCSFKNSRQIMRGKHGRPFVGKNKQQVEWFRSAVMQLRAQWGKPPLMGELAVRYVVVLGPRQRLDLDNAILGAADALQQAGVILNDNQIKRIEAQLVANERDRPRIEVALEVV